MASQADPGFWDMPIAALAYNVEKLGRGHHAATPAVAAILQARVALETSGQQERASDRLVKRTDDLVSATNGLVAATRNMMRATVAVAIVGAIGVLSAGIDALLR
jgi:hypothetical protein